MKREKIVRALCALLGVMLAAGACAPPLVAHAASGWTWRVPIVIRNGADVDLNQHQVRVELSAENFDFARAADDLRDLRFATDDGVRWQPHWLP